MLMYHSVSPRRGTPYWPWSISLRRFCSHLDFLAAEGWATPTMAQLVDSPQKWPRRSVVITFDDGYVDNLSAWEELQKRGMKATWFIVTGSIGRAPAWPSDGRPIGRLLDISELRAMWSTEMEIGSHTVNHVRLTQLDDNQLRSELVESKTVLEEALGAEISSFAYPYGAWDSRCTNAVRAAGYRAACTTRSGWALRDKDPLAVRRITVYGKDSTSTLARKLTFADTNVGWSRMAAHLAGRLTQRFSRD